MKSTFLLLYFVLGTVVYAQDRLERITENGKTGWRFSTSDPAKHGDIGTEAVDISHSTLTTPYIGAVGDYSFVTGLNNYASGRYSFASGKLTHASGLYSTAMGHATKAEGYTTFAIGNYNAADTSPQQGIFTSTNTAFVIGNGTAQNARSNALGQNISEFRLTKKGKQTITFNVKDMPTGIYFCTLSVDGHRTTARRMIVQ